ncbi:MAG: hydroxyacylglutathione hydrolase [Paracoccus sp. (in: a-proteobacteria)]|uniref:hydroxyacylglutathione hydrolase n=1 Tax=Paracoccus sp. TaxID=267 RepID=UPI0026DF0307|nr:hydroxyacylglutathione hydrolase [Paracoccus sp. (in: a-proteobacteria)]MDO5621350.1 hydroxyacylglutathione hydrolase [Paracoccus sp. (in: a-proteobacteria)]
MAVTLLTLRCLADNYAYLIHDGQRTALIDAPEAAPVLAALAERGWRLDQIALTHHHDDHIQAVPELVAATGAQVIGNAQDGARLPALDLAVSPGDHFDLAGTPAKVIDVSGHTIGHIAYYLPDAGLVFTGDSLMAMGCGRLFEGRPQVMWASLSRLNALPPDVLVCSGHDYCAGNAAFALSIEPGNAAITERLKSGRPCAPATLDEERKTNPFLRVEALRGALDMADAPDAQVFARLRQMKDDFRPA